MANSDKNYALKKFRIFGQTHQPTRLKKNAIFGLHEIDKFIVQKSFFSI